MVLVLLVVELAESAAESPFLSPLPLSVRTAVNPVTAPAEILRREALLSPVLAALAGMAGVALTKVVVAVLVVIAVRVAQVLHQVRRLLAQVAEEAEAGF